MFFLISRAISVQWTFIMNLKTFWLSKKIHISWFKKFWIFSKIFINQIRIFNIACNSPMSLKKILPKFQYFFFVFVRSFMIISWLANRILWFSYFGEFETKTAADVLFFVLTHLYKTSNRENCLFYINFWSKWRVHFLFFFWLMNDEICMIEYFSWSLGFAIFKFYIFIHEFFSRMKYEIKLIQMEFWFWNFFISFRKIFPPLILIKSMVNEIFGKIVWNIFNEIFL